MPKKRNCRRTFKEREIHDRAVALRKMTDEKLIAYVDRQFTAGVDAGRIGNELVAQEAAKQITAAISGIKGIGKAAIDKIKEAIMEVLNPCTSCPMENDCYTDHTDKRHECNAYSKYLEAGGEYVE